MDEFPYHELSDCLDGALHPVVTPDYFGQQSVVEELRHRAASGRFHHGWIFAGPRGVGKATLAYHLARVVLGEGGSGGAGASGQDAGAAGVLSGGDMIVRSNALRHEKHGRLIAQFAHPDMRVLRCSVEPKTKKVRSFIRIDEMRACRDMLNTTASMGGYRFLLIDKAEHMNEASANALLKMLEEPPRKTIFVLISDAPGQIPITVRSRCQFLKFRGLAFEPFCAALQAQFEALGQARPEDVNWQDLWHLAEGSVGTGFELMTSEGLKFYQTLIRIFESLPVIDGRLLEQFVDGVLRDKSGKAYGQAQSLLQDLIGRLIKGAVDAETLSGREARIRDHLIQPSAIEQWVLLWDTLLQKSMEVDEYNLDKKTHLKTSFFALRDVARGRVPEGWLS